METWVTIYTTVIYHEGLYGYSTYFNHDKANKSHTGVFDSRVVDIVHANLAAVGTALRAIKKELKDDTIKGITIYTDNLHVIKAIESYVENHHISVSDKNASYVVGLNRLLGSIDTKRIYAKKQKFEPKDWLKTAIYRKIYQVLEIRKKNRAIRFKNR